ncbi:MULTISPECIES: MSHA operon transcriptional regulator [unclassified Vibrio]|uniref:MSHA operon transcriptional regulator n=1 Tax=unclassified Vibrio TaxID=2614977 RepID=UPI001361CDE2|nr:MULTISPECIES: hypothetical protein [unclassified Vibrio]NAW57835.1 hypothetical protein [Vibrio sp. V36_P2S2PM302]NAX23266.1 hypothetical protein [Vibrio sp. V39_P1S14PM300]NAX28375.1 hypothetical protein [Vibrio sp. V38_P2S17PM301]NAX30125.1 hypothetical protein [Vibrio sp. V37_P2S8PM304]
MDQDKFTNVYRLPGSIQVRIAKWQKTFKGTSDIVLHKALMARNKQFQKPDFLPKGWCVTLFDEQDFSITEHGKYIQTAMRTLIDRKVSYKRVYLSRVPLEKAKPALERYKAEWVQKHNRVAKKYNQIKKKELINLAKEESETLYPSIPKGEFDRHLWNRLVRSMFGPEKKYTNPYFVKKADF